MLSSSNQRDPEQNWVRHPEMQERIAEAEADFREGRTTRAETPSEAAAYLDRLKAGPQQAGAEQR